MSRNKGDENVVTSVVRTKLSPLPRFNGITLFLW